MCLGKPSTFKTLNEYYVWWPSNIALWPSITLVICTNLSLLPSPSNSIDRVVKKHAKWLRWFLQCFTHSGQGSRPDCDLDDPFLPPPSALPNSPGTCMLSLNTTIYLPCVAPTWDHIHWWCPEFCYNNISHTPLVIRITWGALVVILSQ